MNLATQVLTNHTSSIISAFHQYDEIEDGALIRPHIMADDSLRLLDAIAAHAPEAGLPYWRVRAWGLLLWQPLYIAVLSVYQIKAIPNTLRHLVQRQQDNFTLGYQLPDNTIWQTYPTTHAAIEALALQLKALFEHYAQSLEQHTFARRPLLNALLADQILTTLERFAPTLAPDQPSQWLYQEGKRWCDAIGVSLPKNAEWVLQDDSPYQRKSCCLVFRCKTGVECANCPRLAKANAHKKGLNCR